MCLKLFGPWKTMIAIQCRAKRVHYLVFNPKQLTNCKGYSVLEMAESGIVYWGNLSGMWNQKASGEGSWHSSNFYATKKFSKNEYCSSLLYQEQAPVVDIHLIVLFILVVWNETRIAKSHEILAQIVSNKRGHFCVSCFKIIRQEW